MAELTLAIIRQQEREYEQFQAIALRDRNAAAQSREFIARSNAAVAADQEKLKRISDVPYGRYMAEKEQEDRVRNQERDKQDAAHAMWRNGGYPPGYHVAAAAQKYREEAQPGPTIQMQQAQDTRIPWSTRVETYAKYLQMSRQRSNPGQNPIYLRDEAIAYIGPDPATVPVIKGSYKSPAQLAEEARVAKQVNELRRAFDAAFEAAKDPAAAAAAAYAQRIVAFGNAPALPPQAIANGAVLASVVAKAPLKKNQPKKPNGNKFGSKKPLNKLKK